MRCSIIFDPVSIHQLTSLLSFLINCDVRRFISSLPGERGQVSVLPQGRQRKAIRGGEPDTPSKAAQAELKQRPPRERHQRFVGFVLLLSTISQNYT